MNCILEVTVAPEHGTQKVEKSFGKSYCDIHFGGQTFKVTEVVQRFSFTLIDDGDQLVKVRLLSDEHSNTHSSLRCGLSALAFVLTRTGFLLIQVQCHGHVTVHFSLQLDAADLPAGSEEGVVAGLPLATEDGQVKCVPFGASFDVFLS